MPNDTEINPHICKVTLPAHRQVIGCPMQPINDGQPPKPLDIKLGEIEQTVSYQSHDNSHLLQPGNFTVPAKGGVRSKRIQRWSLTQRWTNWSGCG